MTLLAFGAVFLDMPRISRAMGYTSGTRSYAKVNSPNSGVIVYLTVRDLTKVTRGQILGEITSERFSLNKSIDNAQAELDTQKQIISKNELKNIDEGELISTRTAQLKVQSVNKELRNVLQEFTLSQQRIEDLTKQLERQKELQSQGFVSAEAVEQKRSELLQQKLNFSLLSRNQLQLER